MTRKATLLPVPALDAPAAALAGRPEDGHRLPQARGPEAGEGGPRFRRDACGRGPARDHLLSPGALATPFACRPTASRGQGLPPPWAAPPAARPGPAAGPGRERAPPRPGHPDRAAEAPPAAGEGEGRGGGGPAAPPPPVEFLASRGLAGWLAGQRVSLAFTTYRGGGLFLLGLDAQGRLALSEQGFDRAAGLAAHGRRLYLGTAHQLWRLDDALGPGGDWRGHDRLYAPRLAWTTGEVHTHDVAVDGRGRVMFVNALFSCLALPAAGHSFAPLWRPPWVSALAPEDRCHLNGLALADGRPAFATAAARTDTVAGWRGRRADGGVVVALPGGEVVLDGLSMPHSPRWHRGALWVLDSGRGLFGRVDPLARSFEPVCFCPGFARGLAFHGDHAIVGLSRPRSRQAYAGLELDDALASRGAEPRCGLMVVDLRAGRPVHHLWAEGGGAGEVYDVAVLPGARRPAVLGVDRDGLRTAVPGPPAEL